MDEIKDKDTFTIDSSNITNNVVMQDTISTVKYADMLNNQGIDKINNNIAFTVNSNYTSNKIIVGDTINSFTDSNILNSEDEIIPSEGNNFFTASQDINKNKPWRKYIRRRISDG